MLKKGIGFWGTLSVATTLCASASAANMYDCCEMPSCYDDCGHYYVDASYLYWSANLDQLDYVWFNRVVSPTEEVAAIDSSTKGRNLGFGWSSGVRASVGYIAPDKCWEAKLRGTYFHNKNENSIAFPFENNDGTLQFLFPSYFPAAFGNFVGAASASLQIDYGVLDLLFLNHTFSCSCIQFSPFVGLRFGWIQQKNHVRYDDLTFQTLSGTLTANTGTIDFKDQYRGVGIIGGSGLDVPLGCGFSILGEVSGSLLYGRSNVTRLLNAFAPLFVDDAAVLATLLQQDKFHREQVSFNFETELGFNYSQEWCSGIGFDIGLSYFFGVWFDRNNFHNFVSTSNIVGGVTSASNYPAMLTYNGNLQLQGLVVRLGIMF